jgi:hypothetical protein
LFLAAARLAYKAKEQLKEAREILNPDIPSSVGAKTNRE